MSLRRLTLKGHLSRDALKDIYWPSTVLEWTLPPRALAFPGVYLLGRLGVLQGVSEGIPSLDQCQDRGTLMHPNGLSTFSWQIYGMFLNYSLSSTVDVYMSRKEVWLPAKFRKQALGIFLEIFWSTQMQGTFVRALSFHVHHLSLPTPHILNHFMNYWVGVKRRIRILYFMGGWALLTAYQL